MDNLMTPTNPLWDEFCDRLAGPEGCNFREDENGKHVWNCYGGHDQRFARKILESYNVDIDKSLAYFTAHGGHCDCEILFNVNP